MVFRVSFSTVLLFAMSVGKKQNLDENIKIYFVWPYLYSVNALSLSEFFGQKEGTTILVSVAFLLHLSICFD